MCLKEEATLSWAGARLIDVSAETVKTVTATLQERFRLTSLLLELPARLKAMEEQEEKQRTQVAKMTQAQEGGEL